MTVTCWAETLPDGHAFTRGQACFRSIVIWRDHHHPCGSLSTETSPYGTWLYLKRLRFPPDLQWSNCCGHSASTWQSCPSNAGVALKRVLFCLNLIFWNCRDLCHVRSTSLLEEGQRPSPDNQTVWEMLFCALSVLWFLELEILQPRNLRVRQESEFHWNLRHHSTHSFLVKFAII